MAPEASRAIHNERKYLEIYWEQLTVVEEGFHKDSVDFSDSSDCNGKATNAGDVAHDKAL